MFGAGGVGAGGVGNGKATGGFGAGGAGGGIANGGSGPGGFGAGGVVVGGGVGGSGPGGFGAGGLTIGCAAVTALGGAGRMVLPVTRMACGAVGEPSESQAAAPATRTGRSARNRVPRHMGTSGERPVTAHQQVVDPGAPCYQDSGTGVLVSGRRRAFLNAAAHARVRSR